MYIIKALDLRLRTENEVNRCLFPLQKYFMYSPSCVCYLICGSICTINDKVLIKFCSVHLFMPSEVHSISLDHLSIKRCLIKAILSLFSVKKKYPFIL